ncbi:sugar transferase [Gloeothece verrucosa]|uniref:Undecaprenyl-phosphate galactose phosphotransferase n=1 Tax=Gloeothece verrucosa (strain PCC 7822) TaxID=497965 RepID=E0UD47_GLOV7|nr:sugar transferase [Gloeothece verrucosa]ADN12927.1 Undecaprenyl-phosphate galactose phosphotransferase [Gloeothece verrucosa PCC 7822]
MQNQYPCQSCHPKKCSFVQKSYLLQVPPQLTIVETQLFQQNFEAICHQLSSPKRIILDFVETHWIDGSGIIGLAKIAKLAAQEEITLVSWSISPQIQQIFLKAGLSQEFNTESCKDTIFICNTPIRSHPSVTSKLKRGIDIVGALVGLAITAVLFIPIAVAIKWDNSGPIFYSQIRRGYLGKPFRIWKFRSMVTNAEKLKYKIQNQANGPIFKNENDPRITRVGRFLRKTSLDEFPQFWNVLLGDMSLVGTRPPTLNEVEQYEIVYGQRLNVKPGLTGEWQVNGRSKILNFCEIVKLDLKYQKNWSVYYDLKIIFKTFYVLFSRGNGAY